ncbi:MAG: hypothetical protein C4581_01610 [Nitrospiraceae bacterium]|nr:MAG: hypothetical protein C4581_01610 [Nitrospiraceae bacterium]
MNDRGITGKIIWLTIFGIAMAYVESAVVVYLRAIFYPKGFIFPLKMMTDYKIKVEVFREVATIVMLLTVAHLAGRKFQERFASLLLTFGVWDIFYYVWLKVLLNWPATLFDWDILFLIPLPWIGPVIAPVSISIIMIISGILIARLSDKGKAFRPTLVTFLLALAGTLLVLYSFMYDTGATLNGQMPEPYRYELLIIGNVLFVVSFVISYLKHVKPEAGSWQI